MELRDEGGGGEEVEARRMSEQVSWVIYVSAHSF